MNELGAALIGLGLGLAAGVAVVLGTRGQRQEGQHDALQGWLEVQAAELRRLGDAARARDGAEDRLRAEVLEARRAVEALRIRDEERRTRDAEHAEVLRRLAGVLAAGAGKGRAGENVLREHLAELPPGMLECDFRVNGKVVEYGLVLPDGRRLPIDSKWPALRELEALEAADDRATHDAAARDVERIVASRAREVATYLDPATTAGVAVAAVPDPVYEVLRRAHADAFRRGVVFVPYSCALPIVLFLYSLVSSYGQAVDVERCLTELAGALEAMDAVIENKLARAAVMVSNATGELRTEVGRARGSISRARSPDGAPGEGGGAGELLHVVD